MVSGTSCPDENLTALRVNASAVDIKKKRTEPETNAISHPYGTDTGRTGGCAPSANKSVPTVTKSAHVTESNAMEFLTCGGLARLRAERNKLVGYTVATESRTRVNGRNRTGRDKLSPTQANTTPS